MASVEARTSIGTRARRQAIVGILMLPLSVLPFVAYFGLTHQGELIWQRIEVSFSQPSLPTISGGDGAWVAAHSPAFAGGVALLVYHGIGAAGSAEGDLTTSPERFGEQLAMLRAAGMHTVTASEVAAAFRGGSPLPPNAVMISFDDGRSDAMMYADPMLEEAGMRATMFVIADAATDPGIYYESWDGLREYGRTGRWDFQSHSAGMHYEQDVPGNGPSLPALASLGYGESPAAFARRITADLHRANTEIRDELGVLPSTFAYPFGAYAGEGDDRTNDPSLGPIVRQVVTTTYALAFDQDEQDDWGLATCEDDPLHLHRLEVGDWSGRELITRIQTAATGFVSPVCAA
jgi:peptidoglycan/xylan/chitin deacetylase (PgdA/CDA1 family)